MSNDRELGQTSSVIDPRTHPERVELVVDDLDRQATFYREAIGLTRLGGPDGEARLGVGGLEIVRLLGRPGAPRPGPRNTGLFHLAILVPTRPDLARALHHLLRLGVPLQGFADHHVSEAIYLADSEGNGIEIYRDRPRAGWRDAQGRIRLTTDPLDVRGLLREADDDPGPYPGPPEGTTLGHVHLKVADVGTAESFYCDALGFERMTRYGSSASFVSAGGYHHHIGFNTWQSAGGSPPPPGSTGLHRVVLRLPDGPALEAVRARLAAAGLDVETLDGSVRVRDPSDNDLLFSG